MSISMQEWIFTESLGRFEIDLGDSNVDLLSLSQIDGIDHLDQIPLGYGHEAGCEELRAAVAQNYPGASSENVLITHGAQEAFSLLIRAYSGESKEQDGHAIVVGSGWMQHRIFPENLGLSVDVVAFGNRTDRELLAATEALIRPETRFIVVASPDNPTGRRLLRVDMLSLGALAQRHGCLLIVDEEYLIDSRQSVFGMNINVAAISSLSKLHGLPGLRLGWCLAAPELIRRCVYHKHYSTISNSVLCESVALAVLKSNSKYLERAEFLCRDGSKLFRAWCESQEDLSVISSVEDLPFAWVSVAPHLNTLSVARRALGEGVLVIPGEVFARPGFLRLTTGRDTRILTRGLEMLGGALEAERATPGVRSADFDASASALKSEV